MQDRPQIRSNLAAAPDDRAGRHYVIYDPLRLSDATLRLSALELEWVNLFDGSRTLPEIHVEATRQVGGGPIPVDYFNQLADLLDEALFLEGPRAREAAASPIRRPACIGAYEGEPEPLRRQLRQLFAGPGGPGLPGPPRPDPSFCAALIPHIDYGRGGRTFAHAFKEVFERTPASLFVIIGTSHYSLHRFTLTRKHFETPLGIAQTDQAYVDRLVAHYGPGLFDDELQAHLPEHSIELEVVFLQYLYEKVRPFRIVPLVVGSFRDCVQEQISPVEQDDVGRMVRALRTVEQETKEPICYLISGDLAHIGPKFQDPRPVHEAQLAHSKAQDHALIERAEAADVAGYFRVIAEEGDQRRICGLPPTYTCLEAVRPGRGKLLHYDQYVHPQGFESVSFASMAFYR